MDNLYPYREVWLHICICVVRQSAADPNVAHGHTHTERKRERERAAPLMCLLRVLLLLLLSLVLVAPVSAFPVRQGQGQGLEQELRTGTGGTPHLAAVLEGEVLGARLKYETKSAPSNHTHTPHGCVCVCLLGVHVERGTCLDTRTHRGRRANIQAQGLSTHTLMHLDICTYIPSLTFMHT